MSKVLKIYILEACECKILQNRPQKCVDDAISSVSF